MANGEAKVTLLLQLKNKINAGMAKAKQFVNDNVKDMQGKLDGLSSKHVETFNAMKGEVSGFGRIAELATNPYVLLTAALVGLGAAYGKASAMSSQFNDSMLKANVTAQEGHNDFLKTKSNVLNAAANSNVANATQAAPDAFNILLSSGMAKNDALNTLPATLQAAKAGFTDISVVARATAASMNSSGIKDATRLYDILFATLNKGNAEFSDVAQYLPKIIPVAKDVGVNMEQVAGAFAYLTAQGQTSERSATLLENMFKVLGDPDKTKAFKKLGVDMYDTQGKLRPIVDIIDQLNHGLRGLTDKQKSTVMDSLGLDMEAKGAFSAMAQDAGKLREVIDFTTNSQGQFKAAIEASKSEMDNWTQMSNKIDAAWITIGDRVNESLGKLGEWLLPIVEIILPGIVNWFNYMWHTLEGFLKPLFTGVGILITWLVKSQLIKDVFSAIIFIGLKLIDVIIWIADKLSWLYEHTLKPVLDAIEWVYGKAKDMLGLSGKSQTFEMKSTNIEIKGDITKNPALLAQLLPGAGMLSPMLQFGNIDLYKGMGGIDPNAKKILDKQKAKDDKGTSIKGAEQVRNITTNVGSVINGDFVTQNTNFSSMTPQEFERFLIGVLTRYTRGMELGIN